MATIRVTCPICGDIELKPPQMRLVVTDQDDASFYSFQCPECALSVRRPASDDVVMLLISGGVVAEALAIPAEAFEIHEGSVIGYDDILDFALALGRSDALAEHAVSPVRAA